MLLESRNSKNFISILYLKYCRILGKPRTRAPKCILSNICCGDLIEKSEILLFYADFVFRTNFITFSPIFVNFIFSGYLH